MRGSLGHSRGAVRAPRVAGTGRLAVAVAALVVVVSGIAALPALSQSGPDGVAPAVLGAANDTTTPLNLVDVPALRRHRYDGHDLRLTGLLSRDSGIERWAISYRGDGLLLTGTLTLPETAGRPSPLVVVAHGFRAPEEYHQGAGLLAGERAMARAGFAVLHPDFRNHAGSSIEAGTAPAQPGGYPVDLLNAVLALRASTLPAALGIDPDRTGLLGRSMGGGVAVQAAVTRPDLFDALALYSPVSTDAADNLDRWAPAGSALRRRVVSAYGTPELRPGQWERFSSRPELSRLRMPVRIDHGTADAICPFAWSRASSRVMRAAGVDVDLVAHPGEGHVFGAAWSGYLSDLVGFWRGHLGG